MLADFCIVQLCFVGIFWISRNFWSYVNIFLAEIVIFAPGIMPGDGLDGLEFELCWFVRKSSCQKNVLGS